MTCNKPFRFLLIFILCLAGINIAFAQAPKINYSTPQTYAINKTIDILTPENAGGAVPATVYGQVTTFAGGGTAGSVDGQGAAASFDQPRRLTTDNTGNIYVTDFTSNLIRKITPFAQVSTMNVTGIRFNGLDGIAVDANGNLYVSDEGHNSIDKVTSFGNASVIAGNGSYGAVNGPGSTATFNYPIGIAVDAPGNIYIADYHNQMIRKIDIHDNVTTLAGSGLNGTNNGAGASASFSDPNGVGVDLAGNVYVADGSDRLIRKITPGGEVSTYAGFTGGNSFAFGDPQDIVVDALNNLYVTDGQKNQVFKVDQAGQVTVVAGSGTQGWADGVGAAASFYGPVGITIGSDGNLYVADSYNNTIRKIMITGYTIDKALPAGLVFDPKTGDISGTPTAMSPATNYIITAYNPGGSSSAVVNITVTIKAAILSAPPNISYQTPQTYNTNTAISPLIPKNTGGAVPPAYYAQTTTIAGTGVTGSADGIGIAASISAPIALTIDANNNIYVADYNNNTIRKITPAGLVTTLAGQPGLHGYVDGAGTSALFTEPDGVAADSDGDIYVADSYNDLIRLVAPNGTVSTFAGSLKVSGATNGPPGAATFNSPAGLAIDSKGNLYIADKNNNMIRKVTPAGLVSTLAGNLSPGSSDGTGTSASFNQPESIAVDAAGNVYVADSENNLVRKITPAGVVTTLAGSGSAGFADGTGSAASFNNPYGIAVDNTGVVYVADEKNNLIRKITGNGVVTTVAGSGAGNSKDGIGNTASFGYPGSIVADDSGYIYVGDLSTFVIRKIGLTGYTIDKPLPTGLTFDGTTGIISGTPTAASPATDYTVTAYNTVGSGVAIINIAVDNAGTVLPAPPDISYQSPPVFYVNTPINELTPANAGGAVPPVTYGVVSTLAGKAPGNKNGTGSAASFGQPVSVVCDIAGNIYVSESVNNDIRKVSPAGVVSTFAGNGSAGNANGPAVAASFNAPNQLAADALGNIYVTDNGNQVIRKITQGGLVTTFAGSGIIGTTNGPAANATFNNPIGIVLDHSGNFYVADRGNSIIRKINPAGVVTNFGGSGTPPLSVLSGLYYLATDVSSNLYYVNSDQVQKSNSSASVNTLAGTGNAGFLNGSGNMANFDGLVGIAVTAGGIVYVGDVYNNRVRQINPYGEVSTLAGNGSTGSSDGLSATASFNHPCGVTIDPTGNFLYVADKDNNEIRKVTITGYNIDKTLPSGLVFDATTGKISGTPVIPSSPAENYTITAYNAGGSSSAVISIQIEDETVVFSPLPTKIVCDADFDPGATGSGPITYTSSAPSVATIVSGKIHITGAGTSVIMASDGTSQVSQTLTVTAAVTPTVTISPTAADDCQGNGISFTTTVTNGGVNPGYQWRINGQNAGANTPQFTADNLSDGDKVTCVITSNASCVTGNTATSNAATFTLDPPVNTSVKIISSENGPVCKGTAVTFTAIAFSPDINPNYQWQVNGVDEGSNQPTFTSSAFNEDDVVTCVLSSTGKCLVNAMTVSNAISINLNLQSDCVVNVPNTFTPNGDGINDLWNIKSLQAYPGCTVSIFSRAGALLYNSINYPKAWDGTYNGKKLPEGTYYYVIDLKNGQKPLSGPITILR